MITAPHIQSKGNSTKAVMIDVIIALLPLIVVAWIAFGSTALQLIGVTIGAALVTEVIFSAVLLKKYTSILDGSAIITALLLAFTLSPLTPWYVAAFGSFSAVLFGKILWGGLGQNQFNPALVGREFMSVFFATVMTSPTIWDTKTGVNVPVTDLFPGIEYPYLASYLNGLLYKTTGALGEYSIACILLGGLYLILRKRISWHIPFSLLAVFSLLFWFVPDGDDLKFSLAGVLLGTIFMATDMPSSPVNSNGKLYYGAMIGVVAFIFIAGGVRYEYMSYSILLLNGFSQQISTVFKPVAWGAVNDWKKRIEHIFLLTLTILGFALGILSLYYYGMISYLIYLYIIYLILKFNFSFTNKITDRI